MVASSFCSATGSVIDFAVSRRSGRETTSSTNETGEKASSVLPTPVLDSGRRPPTREGTSTPEWPRIFST